MARRSTGPKELVRLSPMQFSLSISIVVILLGAAGLAGYFYGVKQAARRSAAAQNVSQGNNTGTPADSKPHQAGTNGSVTFYSALKEPRTDTPPPSPPKPVAKKAAPVKAEPARPPAAALEVTKAALTSESVVLQVASYKDRVPAEKLLEELSLEGYAGTVVRADLGERGTWYRVRVGPYEKDDAAAVLKKLRDERNLKGYVVKQ